MKYKQALKDKSKFNVINIASFKIKSPKTYNKVCKSSKLLVNMFIKLRRIQRYRICGFLTKL
jgi:hypothetical protein